jgi:uncharacterized protein (TIGR00369 family)
MSVDPEFIRQASEAMASNAPQAQALGFRFVSVEPGRGSIEVPWREDLVGDPDTGVIAGGVVTSLLDHTCGMAIISAAQGFMSTATLDLRIDYMRAAAPRAGVTAMAHCYKLTRSVAFVRAEAWDVDPGDLIATAQGAFIINRPAS